MFIFQLSSIRDSCELQVLIFYPFSLLSHLGSRRPIAFFSILVKKWADLTTVLMKKIGDFSYKSSALPWLCLNHGILFFRKFLPHCNSEPNCNHNLTLTLIRFYEIRCKNFVFLTVIFSNYVLKQPTAQLMFYLLSSKLFILLLLRRCCLVSV